MIETNDYGMYSGGFLFDQMDRAALFYIREFSGLPDDAVLVTKRVHELEFKRQVCDKYNITVRCDHYHETKLYSTLYQCYAEVLDNKGNVCASAIFIFTEATNHCANTESPAENVQPDYVATAYVTDGHTKEYYGQNGVSIVTDHPLPAGYLITIREPETKGGNNE